MLSVKERLFLRCWQRNHPFHHDVTHYSNLIFFFNFSCFKPSAHSSIGLGELPSSSVPIAIRTLTPRLIFRDLWEWLADVAIFLTTTQILGHLRSPLTWGPRQQAEAKQTKHPKSRWLRTTICHHLIYTFLGFTSSNLLRPSFLDFPAPKVL